jgi:hypothetical protein
MWRIFTGSDALWAFVSLLSLANLIWNSWLYRDVRKCTSEISGVANTITLADKSPKTNVSYRWGIENGLAWIILSPIRKVTEPLRFIVKQRSINTNKSNGRVIYFLSSSAYTL